MAITFTAEGFANRFPEAASEWLQLTDHDGEGVADAGVVEAASTEVNNTLMQKIAGRYEWPLIAECPYLEDEAYKLFRCALYSFTPPPLVTERCKETRAWLDRIASGREILIDAEGLPVATRENAVNRTDAPAPVSIERPTRYGSEFENKYRWT